MRNALLLALLCASALTGCTTFKMTAPDSMVVLNEPEYSNYQWRSTTPDGVILAVKVIEQGVKEGLATKIKKHHLAEGIENLVRRKMYYPTYVPLL